MFIFMKSHIVGLAKSVERQKMEKNSFVKSKERLFVSCAGCTRAKNGDVAAVVLDGASSCRVGSI